jgi:hypothetical protein
LQVRLQRLSRFQITTGGRLLPGGLVLGAGTWPVRARRYWLILNMQLSFGQSVFSAKQ